MTTTQPILEPQKDPSYRPPVAMWAGVLGAPIVWACQLQLGYMMVPWICKNHHVWILHVLTLITLLLTVVCFVICWRERKAVPVPSGQEDDEIGAIGRRHFISILGMLSSAMFFLLIFAQGLASFFLSPCWD